MDNKMIPIIKREFMTRVKTKGFIIGTAIFPVLVLAMLIVPILLSSLETEKQQQYVVIDRTERIYEPLSHALDDTNKTGESMFVLHRREVMSTDDLQQEKAELNQKILNNEINGYLIIPKDVLTTQVQHPANQIDFYAKNVSNFQLNRTLEQAVSNVIRSIRLEDSGLDPELIQDLIRRVELKTYKVSSSGEEQEDRGYTFIITYVLVMILYMVLIIYGAMITRSVVEEKNTRVVEVLTASVKPFQLMAGKILGVGAVGLFQFLIWAFFMLLASYYRMQVGQIFGASAADMSNMPSLSFEVIAFFVLFFILGYLFFSTLYAAVGAMVNSDQEAQSMQMPIILFLIVPILIMTYVISQPDSTVAVVLSMLPMFSPIIMFMRISVLMPSMGEILISIGILVASIFALIWITGKIYRVGILMYGKRPTLPELVKWIKYS